MSGKMLVNGLEYAILKPLGHSKGGYSYLAERGGQYVTLKQIHHEPCAYYTFGNKIEAERRDYERLKNAGIRIPEMIAIDTEAERIVKEYIEGKTIFDMVRNHVSVAPFWGQVRDVRALLFRQDAPLFQNLVIVAPQTVNALDGVQIAVPLDRHAAFRVTMA